MVPKGIMLRIKGRIPREVYDSLNQQDMMGPTERYGKVSAAGIFEHGGKYGHLGQFKHRVTPAVVELLPSCCPAPRKLSDFGKTALSGRPIRGRKKTCW